MKPIIVLATVSSLEDARRIARAVVERKLAACAQLSTIESFYTWKGTLEHQPEVRILFKTTDAAYDALERAIEELHPYEVPAIHATPIDRIFEPYMRWIVENTEAPQGYPGTGAPADT
ncbi:MAG TPA: divalent-cation tolerance protein CutA [Candidatus Tectomicrobia bacterium]|nr:divalent-cation tolerance protein CutA [Candidatus Tectomicrobia bacterium]